MKLSINHRFSFGVERYLEIFFDPDFADFVRERIDVHEYRVISLERGKTHITRKTNIVPKVEVAPWLKRALKSKPIAYLEEMSHEVGSSVIRQEILPSVATKRIKISATITLEPLGPNACTRRGDIEISVKIPGVGSKIEAALAKSFSEGYEQGHLHMSQFDSPPL